VIEAWTEVALWAGARTHAWTALKQAKLMKDTLRYHQAQKEELWARAKKNIKEARQRCRRA
jgi:hypothetical protein